MKFLPAAALLAAVAAFGSPAVAKEDCDGGFKSHLSKMTIYVDKMSGYELADAVRKSLDAYNSCKSGDTFSPHGVWDAILADMEKKSKATK
jgi:hypothetical protein